MKREKRLEMMKRNNHNKENNKSTSEVNSNSSKNSFDFNIISEFLSKSKFLFKVSILSEKRILKISIIFTVLIVLLFTIIYFNYILIGDFFSTILFAIVISLAIKPYKDSITEKLENMINNENYFLFDSMLLYILGNIRAIIGFIIAKLNDFFNKKTKITTLEEIENENKNSKNMNMSIYPRKSSFNKNSNSYDNNMNNKSTIKNKIKEMTDISTLTLLKYCTIIYFIVFKLDIKFFLFLIFIVTIIDFWIKISIDFILYSFSKLNLIEIIMDLSDSKRKKLKHIVHSILTSLLLVVSIVIFMSFMLLSFFLLYKDISFIYNLVINQNSLKDVVNDYINENVNFNFKDIGINLGLGNENSGLNDTMNSKPQIQFSQFDTLFNPNIKDLLKSTFSRTQNQNNTFTSSMDSQNFENYNNNSNFSKINYNRNNYSSIADIGIKLFSNPKEFMETYISKDDLTLISKKCEENTFYNSKIMKIISYFSLGYINQGLCFLVSSMITLIRN